MLGCAGEVMDNSLELLIRESSSSYSWVHYNQLRANNLEKGMNFPLYPQLWFNQ